MLPSMGALFVHEPVSYTHLDVYKRQVGRVLYQQYNEGDFRVIGYTNRTLIGAEKEISPLERKF